MARQRPTATVEWQQMEMRLTWPEQRMYEVLRPVLRMGESAESRATMARQLDALAALIRPDAPIPHQVRLEWII